ncbi:phage major tail tube protein [Arcobacter aquimarinus]|uniref:Phage tail tube protein n=1 Tax=Arcobacter aquimarinus TaxID=1315211 RepID=A0AAE7E0M3_9BACT|nr:phage major tail tube protein [Arcobacter aquimarinus]QKE26168.1 phage tail tube protein [Arcobacter aquimarinus]RXI35831.1 phage tail protein [Arcobacter aquimarinus]
MRSAIVDTNAFIQGYGNLGKTVSFKAPELNQKTISGTTGVGDRSYATGQFESLDSECSFASMPEAIFNALSKLDEAEIIQKKAVRTGTKVENHTWISTGAISVSFGDSKAGEMLDVKVSQKGLKKYIYEVNNQTKVRIDHDNLIVEVDGKDLMSDVRRILRG